MNFKFFRGKEESGLNLFQLEPTQLLTLQPQRLNNAEFCFQFDDEEPQVFASGNERCTLNIEPQENGVISFQHEGKRFKLFAREVQQ